MEPNKALGNFENSKLHRVSKNRPPKDKTTEFSTNSVSSKGKFGEKKTEASRQH